MAADAEPDREKNFKLAREQYRKGAEAGHLECQYSYYRLLANGNGGKKDVREAVKWLRQSAVSGFAVSMSELGTLLKEGDGVEKDEVAALGWSRRRRARSGAGDDQPGTLLCERGRGADEL